MKWQLQERTTRRSLLAAGLAIALPMAACIALAQEPDANPSRMATPQGYSARHSVDIIGRVADKVGSSAMYDTLVNLQTGPRVSSETFELNKLDSNKHTWLDNARATGSGFGGDPYNFAKLSMSKARIYQFNGNFRRNRLYFDYDLLGNPNLPGDIPGLPIGPSTAPTGTLPFRQPQHSSDLTNSVRRMTDTDLTLFPQSVLSVRLGYSQNILQGPSLIPVRSGGVIKYNSLMEQYLRHSTDEYIMSVAWKPVRGTQLSYEERFHHYKENSYVTLDPNGFIAQESDGTPVYLGNWDASSNAAVSTTTQWAQYSTAACNANSIVAPTTFLNPAPAGGKPIIDPSCAVITSYQRTNPIRTNMPSEVLRIQSNSIKHLSMNGEFSYSKMSMNMPNFFESGSGLNGTTRTEYYAASATAKRDVYSANFGLLWQVTRNFDLEEQVTLSSNGQPGSANTSGYTKVTTGTAAGQETINFVPTPPNTWATYTTVTNGAVVSGETYGTVSTYFGNEQLINNLTASWAVTPKANLALTYRYGNRNIGLNLNVTPTTTRTIFAITEQAMVLQGSYRVTNNLDFNGTFEAAYNDNAFTAMTPRQLRRYRAHTTYRPTKWATIAATYTDTERHNNTNNEVAGFYSQPTTNYYEGPLKHVDFTRTGGFSAELTPNEHFAFDFDYVYADVFTATNICYAGQDSGFLTGTTSPYFANAASVTSTGAPSVCYSTTSATPPAVPTVTVTQWLGRAFMDAPTQHGTGAIVISPTNKLKYGVGYQINSVNGSQFFTDARGVNGALHSTYETPYMSLDWIARPGFIWKAQWNYYGYGEGGHSGAPFCTLNSVATATAANIVPCGNEPVPTGMNSSNAGMTAPRDFHANNITLGIHYDF